MLGNTEEPKFKSAVFVNNIALNKYPHNNLFNRYYFQFYRPNPEKCIERATKLANEGFKLVASTHNSLIHCIKNLPNSKEIYQKLGTDFLYQNVPKGHYHQTLFKKVSSKKIPLVLMQYPTLPISQLTDYFKDINPRPKNLFFLSNEHNFNQVLQNVSYYSIFKDGFRGTWGHTTNYGNHLITDNVLQFLEKNFKLVAH